MLFHAAHLSWNEVTTDLGGGPLTGLQGYRIYMGQAPDQMTSVIGLDLTATPHAPAFTIQTFPAYGRWYFKITAYDSSNNESPASIIVSKEIVDDGPGGGFSG
jgi:hypothetical protein